MTDDQCKNTMATALSAKGEVRTLDVLWDYRVEVAEEDLPETRPRSIKSSF